MILGFSLFLLGLAQTGLPCFSPWPPWTSRGTISAWYTGLLDLDCRCDWIQLCDFLQHDTGWTDDPFATPETGLNGPWQEIGVNTGFCFPSAVNSGRRDMLEQVRLWRDFMHVDVSVFLGCTIKRLMMEGVLEYEYGGELRTSAAHFVMLVYINVGA
jgi:hypothetical protein